MTRMETSMKIRSYNAGAVAVSLDVAILGLVERAGGEPPCMNAMERPIHLKILAIGNLSHWSSPPPLGAYVR